jgi:cell division protein FtsB
MVMGVLACLTALGIFLSKKEFPVGGVGVLGIGFVLIGMSQWTSFKFQAGGVNFEAVQNLQKQIQATASSAAAIAQEAQKTAAAQDVTRQQLATLTKQLATNRTLAPQSAEAIGGAIARAPRADTNQLRAATIELRNLPKMQIRKPQQ